MFLTELKRQLIGVKHRIKDDSLSLVAAGVAFYIFLSIFPALASVISIYGLISDPQTVENHVTAMENFMPEEVMGIVSERLTTLAETGGGSLTFGVAIGILVSLWSANKAMKAVAKALNIAYDTKERRGFIKFHLVTLGLTLFSTVAFIVAITVVVAMPLFVSVFLTRQVELLATLLSWTLYLGLLVGMYLIVYSVAPDRNRESWKELLPGAIVSAFLFVIASTAFSFYASNFGEFEQEYGALGAVVATMIWLFIGAFIFLVGAELNAERIQRYNDRKPVKGLDDSS
ncbi:YihY/virulence factor BrkB family protein [Marinimicrobium sp. ABcell2]|uniref:YihY/virulence factor BrkB family protein n=1 Tax=Marinimicrobium sp. ABcell2 TaxID=3069751 RepID=UPI0027B693F8|nr:YihY/virulence factor BrkB family protein [Marinimicrobium sp. ABcell2]MDQ2075110.1 YihY/virulence factor BrkB family protein [Marinimicrobium sp. ABcell2]